MQRLYHTPRVRGAIVETAERAQQPSAALRALSGNAARMSSKAARAATLQKAIVGDFFGGNRRAQKDAGECFAMCIDDMRGREEPPCDLFRAWPTSTFAGRAGVGVGENPPAAALCARAPPGEALPKVLRRLMRPT